jgi:hypothetical protein
MSDEGFVIRSCSFGAEGEFMKRLCIATCMAAACALSLAAQQPATPNTPQTGRRMGGPMTLTGCVKAGDTSGPYVLTDIQRNDTGAGSGAMAGDAAGSGRMGRGMGQLMLNSGAPDVDLSGHVGHKVEVTGTMSGRGRMAGGAAATTDTGAGSGAATGGQARERGMRSMNVTSLRMVASTCSE